MKLSNKPLAMAYVPWQVFENVMDAKCGLEQGSIFEDLVFPFVGSQTACQSVRTQRNGSCNCQYQNNPNNSNNSYGRRRY
jgi:hypothetical protein